jgi:hypothetical protein
MGPSPFHHPADECRPTPTVLEPGSIHQEHVRYVDGCRLKAGMTV